MGVFIVVGGTSGIGAALCQQLIDDGHQVLSYARSGQPAQPISGVEYFTWDATTDNEIPELPDSVDGVAYCPGSIHLKPFHRIKPDEFRAEWELNFLGAVKALQAVYPALKKNPGSSVVLFSTVAANTGMPFHASIASSKAAVEGLTKSLAAEWAANNIRVNAIAPSLTDTPLAKKLLSTEDKQEASRKRHPLNRYGSAVELASLAHFLLSAKAAFMTGQVVHMDGGLGVIKSS